MLPIQVTTLLAPPLPSGKKTLWGAQTLKFVRTFEGLEINSPEEISNPY